MPDRDDFVVRLDFTSAQRSAERVRDMLARLRKDFDLAPFEYCRKVRIAPTEMPYSHPEITLNTSANDELSLLASYLHEQMHWYVTWYAHVRSEEWRDICTSLRNRYPQVPAAEADGARRIFHIPSSRGELARDRNDEPVRRSRAGHRAR